MLRLLCRSIFVQLYRLHWHNSPCVCVRVCGVCVYVFMWHVCVRLCGVCVCDRECGGCKRERESVCVCVCVCKREGVCDRVCVRIWCDVCVCVCVRVRVRVWERVCSRESECVSAFAWEGGRECVCFRVRERECVWERVCLHEREGVCVCAHDQYLKQNKKQRADFPFAKSEPLVFVVTFKFIFN